VQRRPANAQPDAPPATLDLALVRTGAGSVYGNIEITAEKGSTSEDIGLVKGIAIYPEIGRRAVSVPLTRAPLPGETLKVSMIDDDGTPGKVIASVDIDGK
jgi:hypothetical protein